MKIAVTGANSSVGLNLLAHLGEVHEAVAVVRSQRASSMLPSAPHVTPHIVSYSDVEGVATALEGAQVVVHLAGILIEGGGSTYWEANVGSAASVAEAASRAGAHHLVLVSVVGADAGSGNRYLASKGESERVFAAVGLPTTVLRTPILLGPGTAGSESLVRTASRPRARLLGGGTQSLRPLDIDDLSRVILRTCERPPVGLETLEVVGPEAIPYRDLVARAARAMGSEITIGWAPIALAKAAAFVTSRIRGGGVSPDVIDVITSGEVVESNAADVLGVELTPLEATLDKILPNRRTDS